MALPDPGRSRAVLIGTRSYAASSALGELPGVTGNVMRLGRLLTTATRLSTDNCRTLLDRRDDREVCQAVRQAAREAEDLLLVYFAGHGLLSPDSGELFLALTHSDSDDPLYTAVRFSELREAMAVSGARNRVLILDCCFSGRAIVEAMGPDVTSVALAQTHTRGGYTLTATSANRPSIARPGEPCTLFTGALLDLVEQGIDDAGPYVTLGDLFRELERTLDPKPRQQGSDSVSQLALAPNPRYRRPQENVPPMAAEAVPETEAAVTFRMRKLRAWPKRLFVEGLGLALAAFGTWVLTEKTERSYPHIFGGGLGWYLVPLVTVGLLGYTLVSIVLPLLFRLPGHYELRVDSEGLTYRFGAERGTLRWHDVERITTVRSRDDRGRPDWVVVWIRQGYLPPRRSRYGPRTRRSDGALLLCRLGWLAAEPAAVERSIAHYGGGLWDGTHGLATAAVARFRRRRSATLAQSLLTCGLALCSAGCLFLAVEPPTVFARIAALLWLVPYMALALRSMAGMFFPHELVVDAHGVLVRSGGSSRMIPWLEISDAAMVDTPGRRRNGGVHLLLRAPRPEGMSPVPYDTRLRALRLDTTTYAVTPDELDTVLRRWAGGRWRGRVDEGSLVEEASSAEEEARFTGRPVGPVGCVFGLVAIVMTTWLYLELVAAAADLWAGYVVLPLLLLAMTPLAGVFERLHMHLELSIDAHGVELAGRRRRTRLPWADISQVSVVRVPKGRGHTHAVVVWLRNGAAPPRKWRWQPWFTPYSGGLRVVDLGEDGIAAEPKHVARVLADHAGSAWQPSDEAPEDR
ncbi:caspase, EACC1-associated type [Streptomyces sp. NPDC001135]